jgi:hypothetical protein
MERRMPPIPDPRDRPRFDRIDMNIVDMTREIVLVADRVLPITPLLDTALTLAARLAEIGSPAPSLREN